MADAIYVDVSAHNALLDGSYPHPFVMFRLVNEYGHTDAHAKANLATALAMRQRGELANFGGYVNPGHVPNVEIIAAVDALDFPHDAVLMLDIEHWPDSTGVPLIAGDHSVSLDNLTVDLRARQGGRAELVWAYGNRGDLAAIWPNRLTWVPIVTASYTADRPAWARPQAAWQYTNGTENLTNMPMSSPPFGHCDHNVLLVPIPQPGGPDMALDPNDPTVARIIALENLIRLGDDPDPATGDTHPENLRNILGQLTQIRASLGALNLRLDEIAAKIDASPGLSGSVTLQGTLTTAPAVPIADGG